MAFNRKTRLQANIDAIRTAFALRDEVRVPTDAEREVISRYCGFGGLKCVLNPVDNKAAWSKNDLPLYDLTAYRMCLCYIGKTSAILTSSGCPYRNRRT